MRLRCTSEKRLIPSNMNRESEGLSCLFFCLFCSSSHGLFYFFLKFLPSIILHFLHFHDPSPLHTHERKAKTRRNFWESVIFHEILRGKFHLGLRFNVLSFRYLSSRIIFLYLAFPFALLAHKHSFHPQRFAQRWKTETILIVETAKNSLSTFLLKNVKQRVAS